MLTCTACDVKKHVSNFSPKQARRSTRKCKTCCKPTTKRDTLLCKKCTKHLLPQAFSPRQRKRGNRICLQCVEQPKHRAPMSLSLGPADEVCQYCSAALFQDEQRGFCCGNGKNYIDFATCFATPDAALAALYKSPNVSASSRGSNLAAARSQISTLDTFSAQSRKYNMLFCMAQHEIQATTVDKEVRFSGPFKPSNIRIHGTMCRKVLSCEDHCPLRYLVIDPRAREQEALKHQLNTRILKQLTAAIVHSNPYMKAAQRLANLRASGSNAHVRLEWQEGLDEVAAIVDDNPTTSMDARKVVIRRSGTGKPDYLHPLSPIYEPLSYPLWFPYGGHGWHPGLVTSHGHKVSQMWWYRQLALRCSYMHACGRLLNEWFINMYCRMEDERFSVLRHLQRQAQVRHDTPPCEVVRNDVSSNGVTAKDFCLPASVPGSPRHLRRLRVDALELARRRGAPTFFLTLTCNPRWSEIQAGLLPGQTAADRPDLVVRVFHLRLEKLMRYIKTTWCPNRRYTIKVIEYQRRGLPHGHVVIAMANPPTTPEEIDEYISCTLPSDHGAVYELVLQHMVHGCSHSCRPVDPCQDCIKGCPWPFTNETSFDARGYPVHRRQPCAGTCPNCASGEAKYGRRKVCCNQLIVEYSPELLLLWDGHINVKFAGSVELFEYLYKCLFKGPDKANYDVTMDPKVKDELAEWLRGRYLCATECAWRIMGYNTYERTPTVICLPVHLEREQPGLTDTDDAVCDSFAVSPLLRHFARPDHEKYNDLIYFEYFESFIVSSRCPVMFRHVFPSWHPEAQTSTNASTPPDSIHLDQAPVGSRCFVYERLRRERPLCRLEMKYPKQKEVFYLRQILLRYPKRSFADCKEHAGATYATYEEAALASGMLQRNDEAKAVLDEIVALRYTANQLRFAFVVLIEQEPDPITLYNAYEHAMMKDFLAKGLSAMSARRLLRAELKASWLAAGNTEEAWALPADQPLCTLTSAASQDGPCAAAAPASCVERDFIQWSVVCDVRNQLQQRRGSFIFVPTSVNSASALFQFQVLPQQQKRLAPSMLLPGPQENTKTRLHFSREA